MRCLWAIPAAWLLASAGLLPALAEQPQKVSLPAPELRQVSNWINSPPLTLEKLRGNVVVVHFWTFGCINCERNHACYNGWQRDYGERGLTLIGLHAPEYEREKNVARVEAHCQERKLSFPVAVDNELANWKAWGNRFWPCVYLVDKRGQVRYRWEGELNHGVYRGDKALREKFEELLAEK